MESPTVSRRRPSGWLPLLVLLVPASGQAAELKPTLELELGQGHDSNPLELPSDQEGGFFTQVELDAGLDVELNPEVGLFVHADGTRRLYRSALSDGDYGWADARAGAAFTPYHSGFRRLSVGLGGTYGSYRSTFIDPATGQVLLFGSDPNTAIEIPDRFDFDSAGAFLDLRLRLHRSVLLFLDSRIERRDFVDKYDEVPALQSLDDRTLTVEPGARWLVGDRVTLEGSFVWMDRKYDHLHSLDQEAVEVPGTRREYRYKGLGLTLGIDPYQDWNISLGHRGTERDDRFAGYYDSEGTWSFLSVAYSLHERNHFLVYASRRTLHYDNATVDLESDGRVRGGEILQVLGRADRGLGDHFSVFFEAALIRTDDRDPIYVYDRDLARVGLRWKL